MYFSRGREVGTTVPVVRNFTSIPVTTSIHGCLGDASLPKFFSEIINGRCYILMFLYSEHQLVNDNYSSLFDDNYNSLVRGKGDAIAFIHFIC